MRKKIQKKRTGLLKTPNDYPSFTFRPNEKVGPLLARAVAKTKRSKSSIVNECAEIGLRAVLKEMGVSADEIDAIYTGGQPVTTPIPEELKTEPGAQTPAKTHAARENSQPKK